eukprot:1380012-Amorphochlora_amoeboformis.AAC.1
MAPSGHVTSAARPAEELIYYISQKMPLTPSKLWLLRCLLVGTLLGASTVKVSTNPTVHHNIRGFLRRYQGLSRSQPGFHRRFQDPTSRHPNSHLSPFPLNLRDVAHIRPRAEKAGAASFTLSTMRSLKNERLFDARWQRSKLLRLESPRLVGEVIEVAPGIQLTNILSEDDFGAQKEDRQPILYLPGIDGSGGTLRFQQ